MAINDNATLVINAGNYFVAAAGTPFPADPLNPSSPWENVGHTSLDEILALESEGGEATILATLQRKSLRTIYSPRQETFTFNLMQFDEDSLKLHFGSNMIPDATGGGDGLLGVPVEPVPTQVAWLAVFVDGDNYFCFYAAKAEAFRGDNMSLEDTESLASLPVAIKPLQYQDNEWAWAVTPLA